MKRLNRNCGIWKYPFTVIPIDCQGRVGRQTFKAGLRRKAGINPLTHCHISPSNSGSVYQWPYHRDGFIVDGSWPIQTEMRNRTRAHASAGVSGLDDVTTYYPLHRHDFGLEEAPIGACIPYAISCGLSDRDLMGTYDLLVQKGRSSANENQEDSGIIDNEDSDERSLLESISNHVAAKGVSREDRQLRLHPEENEDGGKINI